MRQFIVKKGDMQKNVLICKIVPQKGIHAELYTKATNENIAQHPLFFIIFAKIIRPHNDRN